MFIITDWANNVLFDGKIFEDFDDADMFLSDNVSDEDREDILIVEIEEGHKLKPYIDSNLKATGGYVLTKESGPFFGGF